MAASLSESDFLSDSDEEENILYESFDFPDSSTCWICNGYYGPNFGEPLCGTCHAFIYPTNPFEEQEVITQISDDEDSGNDEPLYTPAAENESRKTENRENFDNGNFHNPCQHADNESNSESTQNENDGIANQRPQPVAPNTLSEYLELLSEPRNSTIATTSEKDLMLPLYESKLTIESLPVEVLISIFSYLDDISLWNVGEVCKQWRNILEINTSQLMWKNYLRERWPLYKNILNVKNWFKMYSAMMSSCFCRTCILQMALEIPLREGEYAIRENRLRNESLFVNVDASDDIEALPLDKQNSRWQASILGPTGSPYEGGKFFLYIFFPKLYPMHPPIIKFLTKILHPNVSRHGDVGIDIIQHNWSTALTIPKLLLSVQSLLTDPYTKICMEPVLGRMYVHNRKRFEALARSWTWKYAMFEAINPR